MKTPTKPVGPLPWVHLIYQGAFDTDPDRQDFRPKPSAQWIQTTLLASVTDAGEMLERRGEAGALAWFTKSLEQAEGLSMALPSGEIRPDLWNTLQAIVSALRALPGQPGRRLELARLAESLEKWTRERAGLWVSINEEKGSRLPPFEPFEQEVINGGLIRDGEQYRVKKSLPDLANSLPPGTLTADLLRRYILKPDGSGPYGKKAITANVTRNKP